MYDYIHSVTSWPKIHSKWIKDLNVRPDTIKLLEKNIGRTLFDINLSNIFFNLSPRVMETKTKINKWDLIKLKIFCISKETKNEKTIYRMGQNICKQCNLQGINFQNTQITLIAQYKKNKNKKQNHSQKVSKRSK